MLVSTTELQNNFGKYLKQCENRSIVITKNGKKRALLVAIPSSAHGFESAEPEYSYGTAARTPNPVSYQEYLQLIEDSGIEEYWIVDPKTHSVEVYGFGAYVLQDDMLFTTGQTVRSFRFPHLSLSVDALFSARRSR